jgi:PIN domain nuclease of toxin-antitoxin system
VRLLLDTHAFLSWLAGDEAVSAAARTTIADANNDVFVSAASAWEIATKHRIGKLPGVAAIVADLDAIIARQSFIGCRSAFSMGGRRVPCRDRIATPSIER